jgi:glycosyltransferase 2 family protein
MRLRFHVRTIAIGALAVGLLALFLRNADLDVVWAEIRNGRTDLLLLAIGTTLTTYIFRAFRWQYLLRPLGPTRFTVAVRATVIGFATSFLLPARAGEFVRPYLLARHEGLSATACFATIILERLLDAVTVLLLFASFVLLFDPGMAAVDARTFHAIKVGGLVVGACAVVAFAVVVVLAGHAATLGRISLVAERILPKRVAQGFSRVVEMFAEGLAAARQPGRVALTLLMSIPLWLSIAAGIWLVALAFHIDLPYTGSFLLVALLVVGVAVPTPGAIGGYHEAFRIGATAFYGVANDRAVGAAIVLHAISFVPVTLLGIIFMAQEGLSLGRMRKMADMASAEERVP